MDAATLSPEFWDSLEKNSNLASGTGVIQHRDVSKPGESMVVKNPLPPPPPLLPLRVIPKQLPTLQYPVAPLGKRKFEAQSTDEESTIDVSSLLSDRETKKNRLRRKAFLARQCRQKKKMRLRNLEETVKRLQEEIEFERSRRLAAEVKVSQVIGPSSMLVASCDQEENQPQLQVQEESTRLQAKGIVSTSSKIMKFCRWVNAKNTSFFEGELWQKTIKGDLCKGSIDTSSIIHAETPFDVWYIVLSTVDDASYDRLCVWLDKYVDVISMI